VDATHHAAVGRRSPESMTDRAVLLPERFRAGCAFGAGPVLAGPVSPTGQIETGIVRPPHRHAKLLACVPEAIFRVNDGHRLMFAEARSPAGVGLNTDSSR